MEPRETIGKRISTVLDKLNMTQRELAQKINVTEVTIGRYINDIREPKGSVLRDIAVALGVTTDYLLGSTSDPKLTAKDEKDISKKLESILNEMSGSDALMFDGEKMDMDEESKELLKSSIENSLRLAKKLAKEKYTPKKYKK